MTKILIADDQNIMRRGLRGLLESHFGWEVVAEAKDGYNAVDAAMRTLPDVAILDSALPGMNGFESAQRIRRRLPKTEVCIFTHCNQESTLARALGAGARGFVLKSDTEEVLLAAVEALSKHHPYFSCTLSESLLEHCVKRMRFSPRAELLTPREREVVQLVAEGLSNKQVGQRLDLSIKTIESHRGAAMRKAGLSSTADLVRYAVRNNFVQV